MLTALLCGCSVHPPAHDTEPAIRAAIGLSDLIAYHTEGSPVDEPGEVAGTLTLSEATRQAVMTDPGLQAALARVRVSLADARQARLLPNPVLNIAVRFPERSGRPIVEASLAQDIVSILRMPRQSSAADHRLRQAASQAVTVALDIASEVQERYATSRAIDELLPVLERRHELVTAQVGRERDKLAAGEGNRQDVATLDAQRVELEVDLDDAQRRRRDERLRLARLIGRPSSPAEWPLEHWAQPRLKAAPEAAWIDAALVHRPEVQAACWKLAALGDENAVSRLSAMDGTRAGVTAERDDSWTLGPSLDIPIPIFDTGQARSQRASAERVEARHELSLARRRIVEEVRRAYDSFTRIESNLNRVRHELIPLQEQRRSLAEATFRAGHTDITPLHLAEQDLHAARARAIDLERDATIALIRLERAVGGAGAAATIDETPPIAVPSTTTVPERSPHDNH